MKSRILFSPLLLMCLLFAVTGCETTTGNRPSVATQPEIPTGPYGKRWVYVFEKAYYAQHRLIRDMVLKHADFVEVIKADRSLAAFGKGSMFRNMYDWNGVSVELLAGDGDKIPDIIFLTFPEPKDMPLCYHAAIVDLGETARYITLEMTTAFPDKSIKACLCEWFAENKGRTNYGPVAYSDLASFKDAVIQLLVGSEEDKEGNQEGSDNGKTERPTY
ncbi:MAG: hypothetical protein SFY80_07665 [Verrucomicrobiota bacterium]|nr:hypothetical protein [Verrucomicrobiota bacterium]